MTEHDLRVAPGRTYRYNQNPTYSFGHGLSLTTWNLTGASPACLHSLTTAEPNSSCQVHLTLANTGPRAGDSVVLAYFRQVGTVDTRWRGDAERKLMPQIRQLFDFHRVADV